MGKYLVESLLAIGLSILLHGVISLPDTTSYNKACIYTEGNKFNNFVCYP